MVSHSVFSDALLELMQLGNVSSKSVFFFSGGDLIIWKLHSTDAGQTWKVLKMLRYGLCFDLSMST